MGIVIVAVVLLVVVLLATEGRRRWLVHQLRTLAAERGLRVEEGTRPLPRQFDIPGRQPGGTVDMILVDPDGGAMCCRHRWNSRRGERNLNEDLLVLVPLPFHSPQLMLRPPTAVNRLGERLGLASTQAADYDVSRKVGLVDVEVGHAAFDETWQVSTDDERFAQRLAGGRAGTALMHRSTWLGERIRYEFVGRWLLVSGLDWSLDTALGVLEWVQPLPRLFPAELVRDYALDHDSEEPWG